jgi:multidrug efflux system membrane fusion protein
MDTARPAAIASQPPRRRFRRLFLGATAVLLAGAIAAYVRQDRRQAPAMPPPAAIPVILTQVQQRDVPIVLTGLGTVTALNTVTVRSQVTGQLISVDFREGQAVKKGDLLAQIDPRTYQAQLDQAEATHARDEAHLANAQANLGRYVPLQKEGFAPDQQVAGQRAAVLEQENQIKADQAAVDLASTELSYTRLVAPIDGVTGLRLLDAGNIIRAADSRSAANADSLVVVTQVQPISVIFTLAANDILPVQEALAKGPVTTLAFSADGKTELDTGRLLLLDNLADPSSGTIRLKAEFPNLQRRLWPGTFVNIEVVTATQHDGLTVPLSAVQEGPQGRFVFVVAADRKVSMRPVSIRQTLNGEALIERGLAAGETVVAQGQYRLVPGALVTAADPRDPGAVSNGSSASAGMLP